MTAARCIAYLRVSTDEQGSSRLGLEAQRAGLEDYIERNGYECLGLREEVVSGATPLEARPVMRDVLGEARRRRAKVLVYKLDRLSRSVHVVSGLIAEGVEFEVAQLGPQVPTVLLHVLAAVSEEERRLIRERTCAALAAKKARGEPLGKPENLSQAANVRRRREAILEAEYYRDLFAELGSVSLREAARLLNERRVRAPAGGAWSHTTVHRVRERLEAAA